MPEAEGVDRLRSQFDLRVRSDGVAYPADVVEEVRRRSATVGLDREPQPPHMWIEQLLQASLDEIATTLSDDQGPPKVMVIETSHCICQSLRLADGTDVIVLSWSLCILISRVVKCYIAAAFPEAVQLSSRGRAGEKAGYWAQLALDAIAAFVDENEVRSELIVLSEDWVSVHSFMLHSTEMFMLLHELGHVLYDSRTVRIEAHVLSFATRMGPL